MINIEGKPCFFEGMIDNGIHEVTEEKINEKGEKVKVVKKIHRYTLVKKVPTAVIKRKETWKKFGKALEKDNDKCTFLSDHEVFMEPPESFIKNQKNEPLFQEKKVNEIEIKCSKCNEKHWSRICPEKEKSKNSTPDKYSKTKETFEKPPPSLVEVDRSTTVLITNLTKDTKEYDLYDLIMSKDNTIKISKIYIPKEFNTDISKGIAFVMTRTKKQAESLISVLNNVGNHNLILKVSFVA
jgi:Eukaryotic translation initiation factor 3 subunit G/RNA recognition motif. (a.k.a. RRM, RBD, or RNP domain)